MHYGDEKQQEQQLLEITVYKHSICGRNVKRNKNGLLSKTCVDYAINAIQDCKYINPNTLMKLFKDPYKYLAKDLDQVAFEEWIWVKLSDEDGYGDIKVRALAVVSEHPNEFLRLH